MRKLPGQINIWGETEGGEHDPPSVKNEMPVDMADFLSMLRVIRRQMPILKKTVNKERKEILNQSLIKFWNDTKRFLEE